MRKSIVLLAGLWLGSSYALAYEYVPSPTISKKKVNYEIVVYDSKTHTDYTPAAYYGFCSLRGYSIGNDATGSYADGSGPYVILNRAGEVVETFLREGNEGRFRVMFQVYCYN